MKFKLSFAIGALCTIAFTVNAQTKGTNSLSFGLGFTKQEYKQNNTDGTTVTSLNKSNNLTLGYGYFFKENEKLSLDLIFGENENEYGTQNKQFIKEYGANMSYQKYYPLVKKLYAYAGGKIGYTYGKQNQQSNDRSHYRSNDYSAGAFGGISLFLSKRLGLETTLLSANMGYQKTQQTYTSSNSLPATQETENTFFGISSGGAFNNLGFKIHFLF